MAMAGAEEPLIPGMGDNAAVSEDGRHRCPACSTPTVYQAFSGGREWWCENCQMDGRYPEGEGPRRVKLLREGRIDELKEEMRRGLVHYPKLLVPSPDFPPHDPHAATMPWESFDADHPDHGDFVVATGRCFAKHDCPYLESAGEPPFTTGDVERAVEALIRNRYLDELERDDLVEIARIVLTSFTSGKGDRS